MIDFESVAGDLTAADDERLVRLRDDQRELWGIGKEAWIVIPVTWTQYFAIATSRELVRRMNEILLANLGPTISPSLIDYDEIQVGGVSVFRAEIKVPETFSTRVREAVTLLVHARRRAPAKRPIIAEQLSRLLAEFFVSLRLSDEHSAKLCLERIRLNGQLRAENLLYLELQLQAKLENWRSIRNHESYSDLCKMRLPTRISSLLLEATWVADFETHSESMSTLDFLKYVRSASDQTDFRYLCDIVSVPDGIRARRLLAAYLASHEQEARLKRLLSEVSEAEQKKLRDLLGVEADQRSESPSTPSNILAKVSALYAQGRHLEVVNEVLAVEPDETLSYFMMMSAISLRSSDEARAVLDYFTSKQFEPSQRDLVDNLSQIAQGACRSWWDWITRLNQGEWREARNELSSCSSWSTDWLNDEQKAISFGEQLGLACESVNVGPMLECLDELLDLIATDCQYVSYLSDALVIVFSDLSTENPAVRNATIDLLEAVLQRGCTRSQYADLIDLVEEIWNQVKSIYALSWLVEVLEVIDHFPCADELRRLRFLNSAGSSLIPFRSRLPRMWTSRLQPLLSDVDFSVDRGEVTQTAIGPQWSQLNGKRIGVYSLSEKIREVEEMLEQVDVKCDIRFNSDEDFSARLRDLARNSDIFVTHTAVASHSATTPLSRQIAGVKLYANGRSVVSVVRALEAHVSSV